MIRILVALFAVTFAASAQAAGTIPAVNSDMGCTTAGQAVQYNGTALACVAPTRPTTTVAVLGTTCTSGQQGQMFIVTDALVPAALAIVAGSGAVKIGVTCNGTNWIVQ
jgi:hypothetical protein